MKDFQSSLEDIYYPFGKLTVCYWKLPFSYCRWFTHKKMVIFHRYVSWTTAHKWPWRFCCFFVVLHLFLQHFVCFSLCMCNMFCFLWPSWMKFLRYAYIYISYRWDLAATSLVYIYDILMQHQWKKRTLTVPRSQKNKYCRSKTKPGFRLGIWGLDDVWWELALRIPHSWLENWRVGVGPNPLSQPRPFCSFLGCVTPEFFLWVLTTTKCENHMMATLVGWSSAGVWWICDKSCDTTCSNENMS